MLLASDDLPPVPNHVFESVFLLLVIVNYTIDAVSLKMSQSVKDMTWQL